MSRIKRQTRDKVLGEHRSRRRYQRRCWWRLPLGHVWPREWRGEYPYRYQNCSACGKKREESVEY